MIDRLRTALPRFVALAVVFLVAGWFRWWKSTELLILTPDQGRALLAGKAILEGQWLSEGPATSVAGFSLGPLFYYLTALALKFSHFHPVGPALMTAGFGVATAVLLAAWVMRFWDTRTGLLAGVLYGLSPLAVMQSRIALEPSPLPFLVVLFLWLVSEWAAFQRTWALIAAGLLPLLAMQLNFSGVVLWPILILTTFFVYSPVSWNTWRWILPLAGGSWLGLLGGKWLWSTPTSWEYLWRMWLQLTLPYAPLAAGVILVLAFWQVSLWFLATWLALRRQRRADPLMYLLVTWVGLSLVSFSVKTVAGDHALGILFPLPALALALVLRPLALQVSRWHWLISLMIGGLLLSGQTTRFLLQHDQQKLSDHLPVVEAIARLSQNEPYALVYRGHLDVYDAADDHYLYLLWLNHTRPVVAGRQNLAPENQDSWLPQSSLPPQRTLYLYSSADRYAAYGGSGGELTLVGSSILELVQNADIRYNAASPAAVPPSWP